MNTVKSPPAGIERLAGALARAPYLLLALLLLSAGLLLWHQHGMDRVLTLSARSPYLIIASDASNRDGGSLAALERADDLGLRCRIHPSPTYPFCSLVFVLDSTATGKGIDLSQFESMSIDMDYRGPGKPGLRVSLVNFEPAISRVDDPMSSKYNEVENLRLQPGRTLQVPLKGFAAARWWKDLRLPPLSHIDARIDNVIRVELTTPVDAAPGEHVFTVRAVRFHGKWITQNQLLMGLVTLWIVCAVAWPAITAVMLREQLAASKSHVQLLREVNQALQLETRELADQAYRDPLTGALNRQGLRAELMNTSSILAAPLTVIFMDIDFFKKINDEHGHDVGDAALRSFAAAIGAGVRASDRLVRWGGEEFLLLCPGTDLGHGAALAGKLRLGLHGQAWPAGLRVTASFGVAQHAPGEEIGELIKRADAALYQAKRAGRDRVEVDGMGGADAAMP
jgi:diguanylate cyclase (GGDEF)-like protein